MYVENIKNAMVLVGLVLMFIFLVTVPFFLFLHHLVRYVVSMIAEKEKR